MCNDELGMKTTLSVFRFFPTNYKARAVIDEMFGKRVFPHAAVFIDFPATTTVNRHSNSISYLPRPNTRFSKERRSQFAVPVRRLRAESVPVPL